MYILPAHVLLGAWSESNWSCHCFHVLITITSTYERNTLRVRRVAVNALPITDL